MRCSVPSCDNNSENVSQIDGITFFGFPSNSHLRAAWLRALGRQDSPLPDPAVVCSQHFLNDDMYETESGSRQILTGAIPSTVQVCMICLVTDNKMFLMSKHKLEEAYENLTALPPCDLGNLKQTLCVHCAQRLINFSRFRDKSLRARALMVDLVQQHKLITRQHIKMINRTQHKLSSDMVFNTLGPDHCDLHILEDQNTKTETTTHNVVVKIERSRDSVDEDMEVKTEDDNADNVSDDFSMDPLKYETTPFQCTLCCEEFVQEHAYMRHMNMHLQTAENGAASEFGASQVCKPHATVRGSSAHAPLLTETKSAIQQLSDDPHIDLPRTLVTPPANLTKSCIKSKLLSVEENEANEKFIEIDIDFNYQTASGSEAHATDLHQDSDMDPLKYETTPFQCTLCYEEFVHEHAYMQHMSMHIQNGADENGASQVCKPRTAVSSSLHPTFLTGNKPAAQQLSADSRPSEDLTQTLVAQRSASFTTNHGSKYSPEASTTEEHVLQSVKKVHDESKPYSCQFCPFRCKYPSNFTTHMRTHTGEKPYACELCNYKCVTNSALVNHMRTHTGEKPYSCKVCDFKSSYKGNLVGHMRTHTGEKPFSCKFCEYKSVSNSALVNHLRTHTGEKPYSCNFCEYKCVSNTALLKHLRTHTGEKRFSCEVCEYKCVSNSALMNHMRTHTGEKPFSCEVCDYKFAHKSHLVRHMKTHTGEKPYHCKFCEYRTAHRDNLVNHIRTHTGERPYSCELCEYKSSAKSKLVIHMRTHTGEKPFSCDLCDFRCAVKHNLVIHRRSHTVDPLSARFVTKIQCREAEANEKLDIDTHSKTENKAEVCKKIKKRRASKTSFSDKNSAISPKNSLLVERKWRTCDFCGEGFKRESLLVKHLKTHTGGNAFSCKLCQYKCKSQSHLTTHMRTHTGEKPYTCGMCECRFTRKSNLVTHMRTHTGDKPFDCKFCDRKFARNSHLIRHVRSHIGVKPYSCDLCDYTCTQNSDLVRHMRTHTGEMPFSCKLCKYKCIRKSQLVSHIRTHS